MRNIVDYFVNNESAVNICLIDVSKAFDRLNFYVLFMKLMDRLVPYIIVALLQNWYENVFISVKWNNTFSGFYKLTAGVKQGGILSPVLFLVYVDDLLKTLSKIGCSVMGHHIGEQMI